MNVTENSESKKTFVEDELPDEVAVKAAGIDLPLAEAQLVLMLASRVICHGLSKDRGALYVAGRFIYLIVIACVLRPGGESLPPLIRDSEGPHIPDGKTALKRLGLDSSDISALWEESSTFPTSCLPLRCVLAFLPAEAWPTLAAFINCGADELAPRIDEALRRHGQQAGPAPLRNALTRLSLVMRILITLRRELHAENESRSKRRQPLLELPAALEGWTALPAMPTGRELDSKGRGGRGRRDVSAVPPELIREALASRLKKIGWGKRRPLDWPLDVHWRTLKELAVLCSLLTACPRVDHLRLLDVDDFDPTHRFEDGSCGPGLRFRRSSMKNGGRADDIYWKRLPDLVGDVLSAWIICSGRELGQSGAPLLIPTRITKPGDPGARYADGSSLSKFVAGAACRRRPIIPLPGEEWRGYSPHRFRHTITQVVERRFATWKLAQPSLPLAGYDPHAFGELALDHKVKDLGYRDYQQRRRLEEIVALAIRFCWEEFWGDGFQPRGLDPEAIIEARDTVFLLEAEIAMTHGQVAQLEANHADLSRRARAVSGDEKLHALLDLHSIDREIQAKLRREVELVGKLAEARPTLEQAKTTEVVLPDDLDGDEYERRLAEALVETGDGEPTPEPEPAAPLASELLVVDLAELYGVTEMTVRRWRAGKTNSPINPEAWVKVNAKDWRYPVSAIDDRALARIPADDPQPTLDRIRRKRAAFGFARRRQTPRPNPAIA